MPGVGLCTFVRAGFFYIVDFILIFETIIQSVNVQRKAIDHDVMAVMCCRCSPGTDYWFALYKTSATVNPPTYWLDGNPSTYRWWGPTDPNEAVQCIRYTQNGFMDRPCSNNFQYTCKMNAGIQTVVIQYICCAVVCWSHTTNIRPNYGNEPRWIILLSKPESFSVFRVLFIIFYFVPCTVVEYLD